MTNKIKSEKELYETKLPDFDIEHADDFLMLSEKEPSRGKLIYITQDYIGSERTKKNGLVFEKIISKMLKMENIENYGNSYLLMAESVKSLNINSNINNNWREALDNNVKVYIEKNAYNEFINENLLPTHKKAILVSEAEIANLLLSLEVINIC